MRSIFDKDTYDELKNRIQQLSADSAPQWGEMNVAQMLHHLNLANEVPLGLFQPPGKPVFFMRIFRRVLYNDKPFGKGAPTPKGFKIVGSFDFETEKQKAIKNLDSIFNSGAKGNYKPHAFFGVLTNDQWGMHIYKHADHHLKQFGV